MTNRRYNRSTSCHYQDDPFICRSSPYVDSAFRQNYPIVSHEKPSVGETGAEAGFTLIELMITLVVAAVLLGIAIPNFRTFILNARMTTQSNEVVAAMATARSEAIKRNQNVVVCRSTNASSSTPTCSGAGGWQSGWIVFMDSNTPAAPNGAFVTADGDILIAQHDAISSGITMSNPDGTIASRVTFTGSGLASNLASRPYFKLCDDRGAAYARAIVFEPTGRARISQPASADFPGGLTCP